jgi:DNA-binding NarL/FixJ family response regulator
MNQIRIVLADDHLLVAESLRNLLESSYEVVGIAQDGRTMIEMVKKYDPDIVISDISMPLLNGINAAEKLKKRGVRAKIIFMTQHPDVDYAIHAFEAGASGYVLKHDASAELDNAIQTVLNGKTYITPTLKEKVQEAMTRGSGDKHDAIENLTIRQKEVLQLLAEGHSAKEVAAIINTSPRTVEFHKYRIMEALELHSSAELVQYAVRHDMVTE